MWPFSHGLPTGFTTGEAYAVNADGPVIAGITRHPTLGSFAMIWTEDAGPRLLTTLLADQGPTATSQTGTPE